MKRLWQVLLGLSMGVLLVVGAGSGAWAQAGADCPDRRGAVGPEAVGFTIPVGSFLEAVDLLLKALGLPSLPLPPGILIPDITVRLNTRFTGHAFITCREPCCDGLVMSADLLLMGSARLSTIPPQVSQFSSIIPVVPKTYDFWRGRPPTRDEDAAKCAIYRQWEHTVHDFRISLSLAGGLISLPLSGEVGIGEALAHVLVSFGCMEVEEKPIITALPDEIVVPIGGKAEFTVAAAVSSTKVWLTVVGAPPPRPPLTYSAVSRYSGVTIEISPDQEVDGKLVPGGQGVISVDAGADVGDGTTETVVVSACTPAGFCDRRAMKVRYLANRPPQAISLTLTRHHACSVWPEYRATDPDLPDNFGFELYFTRGYPTGWRCYRSPERWWTPTGYKYVFPSSCSGKTCSVLDYCQYHGLDGNCVYVFGFPVWGSAPKGTYKFDFTVFEFKKGARDRTNPKNYGFSSHGVWTLILNNKPPVVEVVPSQVRVKPGDTVNAVVTATDPDGDTVTLSKMSGPGSFPTVSGKGNVRGTYTWKATGYTPWRLVGFRATDPCGGTGLTYLRIRVLQPPRPYRGSVVLHRGESKTITIYVDDLDSESHTFGSVFPGISLSLVGKEKVPHYYGSYFGHLYRVWVSVKNRVAPRTHAVPFTVTDGDGLSDSIRFRDPVRGVRRMTRNERRRG